MKTNESSCNIFLRQRHDRRSVRKTCAGNRCSHSAKYIPTNILIAELQQASATNTIIEYVNAISGYDLLVLDDFGHSEGFNTKKKPMNYHRLFEVLNARENRKATIIAAQIPRSDWYNLFRNDTYADACMDRITKSNFLIELEGPSLR